MIFSVEYTIKTPTMFLLLAKIITFAFAFYAMCEFVMLSPYHSGISFIILAFLCVGIMAYIFLIRAPKVQSCEFCERRFVKN